MKLLEIAVPFPHCDLEREGHKTDLRQPHSLILMSESKNGAGTFKRCSMKKED